MYYVGVDVGGTNIATALVDKDGNILEKVSVPTLGHRTPQEITKDIAGTVFEVCKKGSIDVNDIPYIGVGIPGCFDNETGKVIFTNNMNLSEFMFADEMNKYIKKKIIMGNDANCAALGELMGGAAKGYSTAVMVTIGTGIGGGFVTNKKIYDGFNGAAMEVGHITIDFNGRECNCGRKGCWEVYASATALIEQTKKAMEENPDSLMHKYVKENNGEVNGKTSFECAKKGDEVAMKVVDKFAYYFAVGLCDLYNIFQPEIFIVGGGISNQGAFLNDKIKDYIDKSVYGHNSIKYADIVKATLGNDAGIIGAALIGV